MLHNIYTHAGLLTRLAKECTRDATGLASEPMDDDEAKENTGSYSYLNLLVRWMMMVV